jgi:hypothetical protein
MGKLFDDIGRWWRGPGSQADYEFLFIDIADNIAGQLLDSDPRQAEILEQLKRYRRNTPAEAPTKRPKPVQVPFEPIAQRMYVWLRARLQEEDSLPEPRWARFFAHNLAEWSYELHEFVVKLNGKFPRRFSQEIWHICELSRSMDKRDIQARIVEEREEVARWLNLDLDQPNSHGQD